MRASTVRAGGRGTRISSSDATTNTYDTASAMKHHPSPTAAMSAPPIDGPMTRLPLTIAELRAIAFAFAGSYWLAVAVLPIVGGAFMVQMAATNTVLQTLVDDRLRGRVMAFYTMAFFGTAPIGSLLAGVFAERIGSRWTIAAGGVIVIVAGLWLAARLPALRAIVRPIYIERGILPVPAVDSGTKTL